MTAGGFHRRHGPPGRILRLIEGIPILLIIVVVGMVFIFVVFEAFYSNVAHKGTDGRGMHGMKNLAIIPARGGSKRIPGKNLKPFAGKPMIAWPIGEALRSGIFDRVIVSTDSDEIAAVAREHGADVPFMRPAELSDDHVPTAPVILHALEWLRAVGQAPDRVCCVYPTAPFVAADDLKRGLDIMTAHNAPAAISATTFDFPILRAFRLLDDGGIVFNWPEHELTRSQDLPEFLHDAGQFYWLETVEFRRQKRLVPSGARPVILPRKRVQDLDTPEDWEAAELMAKAMGLGSGM